MSQELPILAYEREIAQAVRQHPVTVIAAETGAGKSTQVPLMLLRAGFGGRGMIGITQPRRVAAMSVSEYVAQCHGSELGDVIGYQIRGGRVLDNRTTRVKFMTEGILLREIHPDSDPQLRRYEVVIVDEAHERGINQDLILALLKRVRRERPELKIIVMSATMDEERFAQHFADEVTPAAPIIRVPGRVFPVDIRYEQETPYKSADACAAKVAEIVCGGELGDILVFLPDEQTIKKACDAIENERLPNVRVLPLYGSQAPDEQRAVFERSRERRVIVATNIAETSITIDGVVHVVDSGLVKGMCYVSAGMSALRIMEHSQAGCTQRAGRAGRTQPGICHRLFSREDFEDRLAYTEPEILRMALDQILLHLLALGYAMDGIKTFEFMDPPGDARWDEAEARLKLLGALDKDGAVTKDGELMERLPAAPILGRMILAAAKFGCVREIVTIAAAFTARQVFVRPRGKEYEADEAHTRFKGLNSDALSLLRVYKAWCARVDENGNRNAWARDNFLSSRALREIDRNREQLLNILARESIELSSTEDDAQIRKAVTAGLIVNLCQGMRVYRWGDRDDIYIHPGSVLFASSPRLFVCTTIVETTKAFARECTAVEPEWLLDILPAHEIERELMLKYDWDKVNDARYMVMRQTWRGILLIDERITDESALTPEELAQYREMMAGEEARREEAARLSSERDDLRRELAVQEAAERTASHERAAALVAELRNEFERLGESPDNLSWEFRAHWDSLKRSAEYGWSYGVRVEERGAALRNYLEGRRREHQVGRDSAARVYDAVLKRFPVCPLCGGEWRQDGSHTMYCEAAHDRARLIALDGSDEHARVIGTFVTVRGEHKDGDEAATLRMNGAAVELRFVFWIGGVWTARVFKSVRFESAAAILPEELVSERDTILRDLAELREARKKLERLLADVKQIEAEVGVGGMKRLTFREEGGSAVAGEGGVRYHAAFADVYPQASETWYCSLGIEVPVRGKRVIEVHPRLKVEDTPEDLAELEVLFRETYPGVPAELLQ